MNFDSLNPEYKVLGLEDVRLLDKSKKPPKHVYEPYLVLVSSELPGAPPLARLRKDFTGMSIPDQHAFLLRAWDLTQACATYMRAREN